MALVEGCKHSLEFEIPVSEVEAETTKVVADVQKKARLAGFRPGKVPVNLVRKYYESEIRKQVLDHLLPRYLDRRFTDENLNVVSQPEISDLHFHDGEPLKFKVEVEVYPEFELGEYKGVDVVYAQPAVNDEDVAKRIEELREQKADYANEDPRPAADGDYAVVTLKSISELEGAPIEREGMMLHLGGGDTLPAFTENLRGVSPGETREFDVTYPEDYGEQRLAGKTVRFSATLDGIRRKELPELNDEFAQDLGDYRNLDELREAVRRSILGQREYEAQTEAKNKIVDKLVDSHEFPIPETFVDRQVRNRLEQGLRGLAGQGVDLSKLNIDWAKARENQKDKAVREVRASLLLSKIAEREAIHATEDEVNREVTRMAGQRRENFAALRLRMEKEGALGRIADHIRTEKTLALLFEHARKTEA